MHPTPPACTSDTLIHKKSNFMPPSEPQSAPRDEIGLLSRCIALNMNIDELSALRLELLSSPAKWTEVIEAARKRNLFSILRHQLAVHGLIPPAGPNSGEDLVSIPAFFAKVAADHTLKRLEMTNGLRLITGILNGIGIEPVLLKGAISLWTGEPGWRQLRDLDILVTPEQSKAAFQALVDNGFSLVEKPVTTPYHLAGLRRHDIPGWIEFHFGASSIHGEEHLPTAELRAATTFSEQNGVRAGFYPLPLQILHGLIHHHFHHHCGLYGIIHLKGLFEFAAAMGALSEDERAFLADRVTWDARLLAAFDLWMAGAQELLGMVPPAGFEIMPDAVERWQHVRKRLADNTMCSYYRGYVESMAMLMNEDRLRITAKRSGKSVREMARTARFMPVWRALDAPHMSSKRSNVLKSAGIVN